MYIYAYMYLYSYTSTRISIFIDLYIYTCICTRVYMHIGVVINYKIRTLVIRLMTRIVIIVATKLSVVGRALPRCLNTLHPAVMWKSTRFTMH